MAHLPARGSPLAKELSGFVLLNKQCFVSKNLPSKRCFIFFQNCPLPGTLVELPDSEKQPAGKPLWGSPVRVDLRFFPYDGDAARRSGRKGGELAAIRNLGLHVQTNVQGPAETSNVCVGRAWAPPWSLFHPGKGPAGNLPDMGIPTAPKPNGVRTLRARERNDCGGRRANKAPHPWTFSGGRKPVPGLCWKKPLLPQLHRENTGGIRTLKSISWRCASRAAINQDRCFSELA